MTPRTTATSRLLQLGRSPASRGLRLIVLLLSACVFAFALHLAWLAFTNPLEIEVREGSVWLHVLAKRDGIDIYDTTRVAFVNMNHGPLDPILKGWLSRCVPALPGHMVTRIFVLLCPVFLLASAYVITRRNLAAAMLAAGTLFLVLCHLSNMMFVGRSDATAVCALVVCGALAHRLLVTPHRRWSSPAYVGAQVGLGAASAALFLTSWRYLAVAGALELVVLTTQLADANPHRRPTRPLSRFVARLGVAAMHLLLSTGLYFAGFAAVWLPVFWLELHGDARSYYRRFFGFFSPQSGWGTFPGHSFHVVPNELVQTRLGSLLLLLALVLGGLYRLRRHLGQLVAWLSMLSAAWIAISYGYFKNQRGGGLHYFFELFAFAWIFILHAFSRGRRWGARAQLVLVGLVAWTLPSRDLLARRELLVDARKQAVAFRQEVARLTHGQQIFGEETHLYKSQYQGELVDTGDTDAAIASSGYFGRAFTRTYQRYARELVARPPKFVMGGLLGESNPERIMSAPLQGLLRARYTLRLTTRGTAFATGRASQGLFERND